MSKDNSPEKYSDILKLLHNFFLEEDQDLDSRSLVDINSFISKEGIDTKPLISDTIISIKKLKAKKRLFSAHEKRARLQELAASRDHTGATSNIKEKLKQLISDMNKSEPKLAAMYFRKLEEVDDEDLQSILEDLLLLEDNDDEH